MNDQYDSYCIHKLGEATNQVADPYEADTATCACADYLREQGYGTLPNQLLSKRAMASAAQLIPTTNHLF